MVLSGSSEWKHLRKKSKFGKIYELNEFSRLRFEAGGFLGIFESSFSSDFSHWRREGGDTLLLHDPSFSSILDLIDSHKKASFPGAAMSHYVIFLTTKKKFLTKFTYNRHECRNSSFSCSHGVFENTLRAGLDRGNWKADWFVPKIEKIKNKLFKLLFHYYFTLDWWHWAHRSSVQFWQKCSRSYFLLR